MSAFVMFLIGAIGIWGGFALALANYVRKAKQDPYGIESDGA